ncbi:MAG TPA: MotA/TolQ/ExbB proton channel family protein [Crenotrichaceae bacterium]|nr:MotA/TolQ/ExbB proton channel family protein [Crenotrichaceae bacterium]
MFDFISSGGWIMWPIIGSSILAAGIIVDRLLALRKQQILPRDLLPQVWRLYQDNQLDGNKVRSLRDGSPLGAVLSAGLINRHHGREIMKEAITEAGRQEVYELERNLQALGTIAQISPLMGLLGTVLGMIKVFSAIVTQGVGNPGVLAGGISEALVTTAAGICVAIPALIFYRYFQSRVDYLVLKMEEDALRLVEGIEGDREGEIQ